MEWISLHEFTFLMLLAGLPVTIAGILYRIRPPKKAVWYYGIRLKTALHNEAACQKIHRDMAIAAVAIGAFFNLTGIWPLLFAPMPFLSFKTAIWLILVGLFVFRWVLQKRLRF